LFDLFFAFAGLRGCTFDVGILEECCFMDKNIFFKIVAPVMSVEDTAVLAISTPEDEFNYTNELMSLGIFRELYLGKPCTACEEAGIECPHRRSKLKLPPWRSWNRQNKLELMIKDKHTVNNELYGFVQTSHVYHFSKPWIRAFVLRIPYQLRYMPQVIHCAVDPASTNTISDWVIGSMVYEEGRKVVTLQFIFKFNVYIDIHTHASVDMRKHRHAHALACACATTPHIFVYFNSPSLTQNTTTRHESLKIVAIVRTNTPTRASSVSTYV